MQGQLLQAANILILGKSRTQVEPSLTNILLTKVCLKTSNIRTDSSILRIIDQWFNLDRVQVG